MIDLKEIWHDNAEWVSQVHGLLKISLKSEMHVIDSFCIIRYCNFSIFKMADVDTGGILLFRVSTDCMNSLNNLSYTCGIRVSLRPAQDTTRQSGG